MATYIRIGHRIFQLAVPLYGIGSPRIIWIGQHQSHRCCIKTSAVVADQIMFGTGIEDIPFQIGLLPVLNDALTILLAFEARFQAVDLISQLVHLAAQGLTCGWHQREVLIKLLPQVDLPISRRQWCLIR